MLGVIVDVFAYANRNITNTFTHLKAQIPLIVKYKIREIKFNIATPAK